MNQRQLHRLSRRAACDLLEGLERGDLGRIERKIGNIRHYLRLAETVPAESLRGEALYHQEQLELLEAITAGVAGALSGIQEKIGAEMEGLEANKALLRHFVRAAKQPACFQAAG